jgi:hypothetical protein
MTRSRAPRQRSGVSLPRALERMKAGISLRFEHDRGRPSWSLGGETVSAEIANLITATKGVEPDNDGLFDGAIAQTWRLCSVK